MIELADPTIRYSFTAGDGTHLGYADCSDDTDAEAYARLTWPDAFGPGRGGVGLRPLANRQLVWLEYTRQKRQIASEGLTADEYERRLAVVIEDLGL
jgi:hypothetical protein